MPKRLGQLWNGLALDMEITDATQGNIAIGLDGDRLVEFRSEREVQVEHVTFAHLIARIAALQRRLSRLSTD